VVSNTHGIWPTVLGQGGPDAACFVPLDLRAGEGSKGDSSDPLADTHAYRIACGS
jgi:hypothetical protein